MIHDEITDVLLRARIPASTKGFIYIHDALEIMDKDSYYFSGKVCALYTKIAKQHGDCQTARSELLTGGTRNTVCV